MSIQLLLFNTETNSHNLYQHLSESGFSVISGNNRQTILEAVESNTIDIVVFDIQMAGRSFTETLQRIREMAPLVQIIMTTDPSDISTAVRGMKSGAFDYLIKPVDKDALTIKINEAFKLKNDQEERIRKAEMATGTTL